MDDLLKVAKWAGIIICAIALLGACGIGAAIWFLYAVDFDPS